MMNRLSRPVALLAAVVTAFALPALGSPPPATAATTTLQAEAAQLTGGARVETEHPGYTGSGYVGGFVDANRGNAAITFAVSGATAGGNDLVVRYANGTGSARTMSLVVNGGTSQLSLPALSNWDTWGTVARSVTLTAGTNSIALRYGTADNGNVNLDQIALTPTTTAPGVSEAESAALSGGAVAQSEHAGYTGSGYVGGFTDGNRGNATATFGSTLAAGAATVALRYANGTGTSRTMSLIVNGATTQVTLPATGGWASWSSVSASVTVPAGANTIAVRYGSADNGNINLDSITVTAGGPPDPPPPGTYELESGFLAGGATVTTSPTGATGAGSVTGLGNGARVIRTVDQTQAGTATATLRFRNGTGGSRTISLYANGLRQRQLTLPAGEWQTAGHDVALRTGVNLLGYQVDTGDSGGVQLDSVALTGTAALAVRGATLPYTIYEAEAGSTNGTVLAAGRTYTTLAAESSGRRAVTLTGTGQYVQVTLTRPANAITVRAAVPDGASTPLAVHAGSSKVGDLALTSRYAWMYGPYPFDAAPGGVNPHRFYDDARLLLPQTYPAGTVLRLAKESAASASVTVDLVDAEVADPALSSPAGYVNVTAHGGTPNGGGDDTAAVRAAVAAAQSGAVRGVWLPAGRFDVTGLVNVAGVDVRGAGSWYTVLQGANRRGGFMVTGSNTQLADFTFDGDVTTRDPDGTPNSDAAIEGNFGTGSLIHHVATNHAKVGLWVTGANGLYVAAVRIRNTMADGVNINGQSTNVRLEQSTLRNTGDDALAMWSWSGNGSLVTDSVFAFNTIALPILANGSAIYGGRDNRIEDSTVTDTVFQGSGMTVSNWHAAVPFSGTTIVQRNTLTRTGTHSLDWGSDLGALWIYAPSSPITAPIVLRDLRVDDSTYQGLLTSWQQSVAGLTVERVAFNGTGTAGMEFNTPGTGTFSYVTVAGNQGPGLVNNSGFTVNRGPGNVGF